MQLSRDSDISKWLKILFKPDTILNPLELIEIQDLIYKQQKDFLNLFLGKIKVCSGLEFCLLKKETNLIKFKLSSGKVLIEGKIYEIKETILECNLEKEHFIKLNLNFNILDNQKNLKQSFLPSTKAFGIQGAARLIYEAFLEIDTIDGYPIALIKNGQYQILNYSNQQNILNNLKILQNSFSNYIISGLFIRLFSTGQNFNIIISPGSAFINGEIVKIKNPIYYNLNFQDFIKNKKYILKINNKKEVYLDYFLYKNEIKLGIIIFNTKINLYNVQNRKPYKSEIDLFFSNTKNINKKIAKIQLLTNQDIAFDNIISENFFNLENTDIYNFYQTAFVDILENKLTLGKSGTQTNLNNVNNLFNLINIEIKNQIALIKGKEYKEIYQESFSEYIASKNFISSFANVAEKNKNIYLNINPQIAGVDLEGNNFKNQTLELLASGFSSKMNNLILKFNNIEINNYQILQGRKQSNGNIEANENGIVYLKFNLEQKFIYEISKITLGNELEIGSIDFYPQEKYNNYPYDIQGNLKQTFLVKENKILQGIELFLNYKNQNKVKDFILGEVLLTEFDNFNNEKILTTGIIKIENINFNQNKFSKIYFAIPVQLYTNKKYRIIIRSYTEDLIIGIRDKNQAQLNKTINFYNSSLIENLEVFNENIWLKRKDSNLTFNLILYLPTANEGYLEFNINSLNNFNNLSINNYLNNPNLEFKFLHPLNSNYKTFEKSLNFSAINNGKLRIDFKKIKDIYPIVNLNYLDLNLIQNNQESNWISKNYILKSIYRKVDIVLEQKYFNEDQIEIYISSNQGQNWLKCLQVEKKILDVEKNKYQVIYTLKNLTETVEIYNLDNLSKTILRKEIKFRFNLKTKDLNDLPEIYNFIAYMNN